MATINLSILTIPTPEPYDAAHPTRQWENLCFVFLQGLWQAKQAEWAESDAVSGGGGSVDLTTVNAQLTTLAEAFDLSGIEQALQDLQFNDVSVRFGNLEFRLSSKFSAVRVS